MQVHTEVDDTALVHRAIDGHVDAFELLVDRHTAAAFRVALRITGDRHDAQDVTQESFLAAWQGLSRFRGDSAFTTWLYQIVTRRALNHATRGRTRHASDLLADVPDDQGRDARHDDPALAAVPAVDAVTAAVARLPLPQRIAVVLHHFEGLPYTDVATVTRSTVPAVRSHLFRARRALAEELTDWGSAVTSDGGGAILPCGASTDELLEQVANGLGDATTAHQAGCRHCRTALRDLAARWAPVEGARALPVDPPAGLTAAIKADIRRRARHG